LEKTTLTYVGKHTDTEIVNMVNEEEYKKSIVEYDTRFDTGQKHEHYYMKNGKLDGEYTEWDEEGNIISQKYYLDGKEVTKEEYTKQENTPGQ
jgi:antitoxin component YwqK of YwqJK toxin-antitoxin module